MSDNAFLKKFLVDRYHMKHIIIGENFRFGKGREGDTRSLKEASQTFGFEYTVVAPVTIDGIRISSTYIRQQLANGQIETTNRMLGRNYSIEGIVIEGDKIGRQMGFPTINIQTENSLLPEGVFKTTVEIEDHPKSYRSITYIGYRPTFMGEKKKVESHIFNFDGKVYGKQVNLSFEKKLRDEIKFDSEISLVKQIRADIENLMVDKEHVF